jgi:hypothetical protein
VDDRDGNYEIYYRMRNAGVISGIDDEPAVIGQPGFLRIAPNPIRSGAHVSFHVATPSRTGMTIYDIAGRLVWTRDLGITQPGLHQVTWEGCDLHGRPVANGVYLINAVAGGAETSAKVVVIR